ncbi:MAG: ATP-dependent Clp protease proteolytic subunit [bacterium]|nr:ATP-dependent Clp protease proteolytic subunit [bacterium]
MKKLFIFFIMFLSILINPNIYSSSNDTVYIIHISGMINEGVYSLVRRGINKAIEDRAKYIVVEIDTFGGLVNSAVKIRDALLDSPIPTVAYVKNRAWSAGALIAIACEKIAFTESGSMGAAEPRPMEEKNVSALRAEFSATAERRKRNPQIAEAMVDQSIEIKDLKPRGKLLTLTASQARKYGYADFIVNNYTDLWKALKIKEPRIINEHLNWSERFSQITSDPTYSFLFLLGGLLLLFIELQIPGFGIPGILGITLIVLTFVGNYLAGLAGIEAILLLIVGIILLLIELHTPGFGIPGISGIIALFLSLYLVLGGGINALRSIILASILMLGIIILFIRYLPESFVWKRIALKEATRTEAGYTVVTVDQNLIGKEGISVTLLRPSGIVEIENIRYDCLTEGEYIPPGTKVVVTKVIGNKIFVRRIS